MTSVEPDTGGQPFKGVVHLRQRPMVQLLAKVLSWGLGEVRLEERGTDKDPQMTF